MKINHYFVISTFFLTVQASHYLDASVWENRSEECGIAPVENARLGANAGEVRDGQLPWAIRIGTRDVTNKTLFYCGGSLISSHFAISAVDCARFCHFVRLGETSSKSGDDSKPGPHSQDIAVKKKVFGNDCSVDSQYRMLILELEKRADLNDYVRPICIPKESFCEQSLKRERLVMSGFGEVYSNGIDARYIRTSRKSSSMQYVDSARLVPEQCKETYPNLLKPNELCVGYQEGASNPCVSDTGGPLIEYVTEEGVTRAYLVGVSRVNPLMCGERHDTPAVYTSVCSFSGWIEKKVRSLSDARKK